MDEENKILIETIFEENQIDEIWEHANPVGLVYEMIETHFRRTTGRIDYDSNMLMAISEFHVNNLIHLKEHFNQFPNSILCKLLNLFNVLLNLRDDLKNLKTLESKDHKNEVQNNGNNGVITNEPDFAFICKGKLQDFKKGLITLDLVYHNSNKTATSEKKFYLSNTEIAALLEYIKTFYFPFIRLYYHFINIEKITENKKIEVIINRPLPVPPLSAAVMQMQEKHMFEEQKEDKTEESKIENKEDKEKKEQKKEEVKVEEKQETYEDLMNKLDLNKETKKIISEKIEEMYKEVDYKISERQKKLDDKYKEMEDAFKGKKK